MNSQCVPSKERRAANPFYNGRVVNPKHVP